MTATADGGRGEEEAPRRPLEDSYWVEPGRLAAGEYPGARGAAAMRQRVEHFVALGFDFFVDLTEEGEYGLEPYAPYLPPGAEHRRMPIRDMHVPTLEEMRDILDLVDVARAEGRTVYVHCFGGIGRTGTVVGCWLVRHGTSPREALAQIAAWRRGTPDSARSSPETGEQRELVLAWEHGK